VRRATRWWWRTESSGDRCGESGRCAEEIITHTHTHTHKHIQTYGARRESERFLYIVLARTPVVEVQVRRPRESSVAEVRAKI